MGVNMRDDGLVKNSSSALSRSMDAARTEATRLLDPSARSRLGQFMTPTAIADFMASLFTQWPEKACLLDPGAGFGSLTGAFAERFEQTAPRGCALEAHGYEIDPILRGYLQEHMEDIGERFRGRGQRFCGIVHDRDFIAEASFLTGMGAPRFTHAILNPPYKKITNTSEHRRLLRAVGLETGNLYSAFLGLTVTLMAEGGEIVAIVPRSFCNGTYFRPFRRFLLERTAMTHLHVFASRRSAFKDDEVLQENIIIRLVRGAKPQSVTLSFSQDAHFTDLESREVPFAEIVHPGDVNAFIRMPDGLDDKSGVPFTRTLADLGLTVSTGPVVDFRVRPYAQSNPEEDYAPLLYAHHFPNGRLSWPMAHKKPNSLALHPDTRKWLMPRGFYTLTKRFSAKEERRRLVAFVIDPNAMPQPLYGFENHLNVFHYGKAGLPEDLARGLAVFLNSTLADQAFREFSGHTQVNAGDLRALRYPDRATLIRFGQWARQAGSATQEAIDACVERCREGLRSQDSTDPGGPGRVGRFGHAPRPTQRALRPLFVGPLRSHPG